MTISYINSIPSLINCKKLTKEQAIKKLALYIKDNYAIFNLSRYDDDSKSEIILAFLNRNQDFFNNYSQKKVDFFSYFYSFVKNLDITYKRRIERQKAQEFYNVTENILELSEKVQAYNKHYTFDKTEIDIPKYCPKNKSINYGQKCIEELKKTKDINYYDIHSSQISYSFVNNHEYKTNVAKLKKTLIVLALKSSYYINDFQITQIAQLCNVSKENLYQLIEEIKFSLFEKQNHKKQIEEKRNNAYYQHKKYMNKLNWLISEDCENNKYKAEAIKNKYEKRTKSWKNLNLKLNSGINHVRPSNKTISHILGISERQISYYLKLAKQIELTQS